MVFGSFLGQILGDIMVVERCRIPLEKLVEEALVRWLVCGLLGFLHVCRLVGLVGIDML